MWNGAFGPPSIQKHRDYLHGTYLEHELDNGGTIEVQTEDPVMCDTDPIDESRLEPSDKYYAVDLSTHDRKWYRYLVRAEGDGSEPEMDNIKSAIEAYSKNRVEGGRDWLDYIDTENTEPTHLARLFASQQTVPQWRQRLRAEYFYPLNEETG